MIGLRPGREIRGSLRVPGSKSIAQRVLLAGSLASGRTRIAGLPRGGDVDAALVLIESAGARVERLAPAAIAITGRPPGPHRGLAPADPVSAGESGTLARLATAALALASSPGKRYEIRAEGTLLRRESRALFEALERAGVEVEHLGRADGWPARVRSIGPPSTLRIEHPGSSQEVSALLLAASAWPDEITVEVEGEVPSRPYLELTRAVLKRFGPRPLVAPPDPIEIEPDASSAAVLLAAGCLSGGRALALGLQEDSAQPDARAVGLFAHLGCRTGWEDAGPWAEGTPDRGAIIDCADTPDLAPVLAALAAAAAIRAGASSRLTGLGTLSGKESDRIAVLARGLAAVGLDLRSGRDWLEIGPSARIRGAVLDPQGDHRMAFAFALLGLVVDGVSVSDSGCVAKSWPGFWEDLGSLR
jgi:3-phosphoshikimate 1-carboxyvinyltransferase